jgi:hypothetical protein
VKSDSENEGAIEDVVVMSKLEICTDIDPLRHFASIGLLCLGFEDSLDKKNLIFIFEKKTPFSLIV